MKHVRSLEATKKAGGLLRPDKKKAGKEGRGGGPGPRSLGEEVVAAVLDYLCHGALVAGGEVGVLAREDFSRVRGVLAEGLRPVGEGELVGREGARLGGGGGGRGRGAHGKGAVRRRSRSGVVNPQSAGQL